VLSIFAILLNTLRIRVIDLGREDVAETGTLSETEFLVPDMVCEGCTGKISDTLSSLPGVREVKAKLRQKHIYVRYEPNKVQEQKLKNAVEKLGYTALEA